MPSERLQVKLELEANQYKREAREAASATGQIGNAAQGVTGRVGGLGGAIGKLGGVMAGVFAGAQITNFARDSIMAASDLEESMNAVNVVFGTAADKIHEFGETSVDAVGLAAVNVNASATVLGSALINAGLSADEAADKTIELTTRASDMASVFNTTVPDALGAMQAALRGESDPIERFGVSLTAAAVDAEAAALGYEKVSGEFDATAKAAARLSLIMKQTDRVAGDFQNTSDGTANTLKKMNERFTEMKARIGTALMPAFKALLDVAEDSAPIFEDVALAVADLFTELKPLIEGIGGLISAYIAAKDAGEDWSGSTNPLIAGFGEYISHIGPMAVLTGNYTNAAKEAAEVTDSRLNPSFKEAGEKSEGAAKGVEHMADATKDDLVSAVSGAIRPLENLADAQKNAAGATHDHWVEVVALTTRLAAAINPAVRAYQALQDMEDAERAVEDAAKNLSDAVADAGADSMEAAEASEALASAQLELAEQIAIANGELAQFGLDADSSVRAVATALGITEEAARELLDTLGLLDGTTITIDIALRQIGQLERGVIPEGMGIRNPTTTTTTTISSGTRRASGGPVTAGQPYLVGERGPELFVSGSSGSIINNDVLRAMSRPNGPTIVMQGPTQNFQQDLQYATILASIQTLVEG